MAKQYVAIQTVASDLASWVLEQSLDNFPKLNNLLEDNRKDQEEELEQRRKELLLLDMFALTRAANDVLDQELSSKLLDRFHKDLYERKFQTDVERSSFEQLANERYQTYYDNLASGRDFKDSIRKLGVSFGKKFAGCRDITIESTAEMLFLSAYTAYKKFLSEAINRFDIK